MKSACAAVVVLLVCSSLGWAAQAGGGLEVFVSPGGDDAFSGRLADRSAEGAADGPVATLERARDLVRGWREAGGKGAVTVWLRGGEYRRTATFELSAKDGGSAAAPVVYRAYRDERPVLLGGRHIGEFHPVKEAADLARIDPAARGHVLVSDLKAQGITDFGHLSPRGFGRPIQPAGLELFFNGKPMELARWPNAGSFTNIAGVPNGPDGGAFNYDGDRPNRWKDSTDIWLHGYWTWAWAESYEKVKSIDLEKRIIATEPPHGVYGYKAGGRYYALNLLEELDAPGEWYLDRQGGRLYFWPPEPIDGTSNVIVSILEAPVISLHDASYITLRGLCIACTRGMGIEITGGSHNLVAGCALDNLGTLAVSVTGGTDHQVVSCDIAHCGEGGIILAGGDRKTLAPGRHAVVNNDISDFSRWVRTYRPAVSVEGVGQRVAHNLFRDAPHSGIILHGNEHVIEFNEFRNILAETADAGAFYMGRDLSERGNIVRFNFFHDNGPSREADVNSIYLDDFASGTTVLGNVCWHSGRGVMIGGGRDNTIVNNVFVEQRVGIHVDARGLGWARTYYDGTDQTLFDRLKAIAYDRPPYSERYPKLVNVLKDEPAIPKGNLIARNICVGGHFIDWLDGMNDKIVRVQDNFTEGDPGFVDPEKGDFRLKPDAAPRKLGIESIPMGQIGLQKDEYRSTLR